MPEDETTYANLSPARRESILVGLYLSRFDAAALKELGFEGFTEAFNVIGYALGVKPASIKNYRDEFDPLFSNPRKGWHKRPTRAYCQRISDQYRELDFASFSALITSFFRRDEVARLDQPSDAIAQEFSQRLITGAAAERYFTAVHCDIPEFRGRISEDMTTCGCGYDFKLKSALDVSDYLAIEVKGLRDLSGRLSMTPKEHEMALKLRERFFLFVVRNFRETPSHVLFQDPLNGNLEFRRSERIVIQVSWSTSI